MWTEIRQAIGNLADIQNVGAPGGHVYLVAIAQLAVQADFDELVTGLDADSVPIGRDQFTDLAPGIFRHRNLEVDEERFAIGP